MAIIIFWIKLIKSNKIYFMDSTVILLNSTLYVEKQLIISKDLMSIP